MMVYCYKKLRTFPYSYVSCGSRKGGLRVFSWFTVSGIDIRFNEETHPYVVNVLCSFASEPRDLFGGN